MITALVVIDSLLKFERSVPGALHILKQSLLNHLECSINGENIHYGTPVNPAAPNRIPGGSSSGSAVAVAANCVDFSLGQCMQLVYRIEEQLVLLARYCNIYTKFIATYF